MTEKNLRKKHLVEIIEKIKLKDSSLSKEREGIIRKVAAAVQKKYKSDLQRLES